MPSSTNKTSRYVRRRKNSHRVGKPSSKHRRQRFADDDFRPQGAMAMQDDNRSQRVAPAARSQQRVAKHTPFPARSTNRANPSRAKYRNRDAVQLKRANGEQNHRPQGVPNASAYPWARCPRSEHGVHLDDPAKHHSSSTAQFLSAPSRSEQSRQAGHTDREPEAKWDDVPARPVVVASGVAMMARKQLISFVQGPTLEANTSSLAEDCTMDDDSGTDWRDFYQVTNDEALQEEVYLKQSYPRHVQSWVASFPDYGAYNKAFLKSVSEARLPTDFSCIGFTKHTVPRVYVLNVPPSRKGIKGNGITEFVKRFYRANFSGDFSSDVDSMAVHRSVFTYGCAVAVFLSNDGLAESFLSKNGTVHEGVALVITTTFECPGVDQVVAGDSQWRVQATRGSSSRYAGVEFTPLDPLAYGGSPKAGKPTEVLDITREYADIARDSALSVPCEPNEAHGVSMRQTRHVDPMMSDVEDERLPNEHFTGSLPMEDDGDSVHEGSDMVAHRGTLEALVGDTLLERVTTSGVEHRSPDSLANADDVVTSHSFALSTPVSDSIAEAPRHASSSVVESSPSRSRCLSHSVSVAPGHAHVAPGHAHAAPGHAHAAPGHENAAPGHAHAAPGHENAAPGHAHAAPGHENAAPDHENAAPGHDSVACVSRAEAPGSRLHLTRGSETSGPAAMLAHAQSNSVGSTDLEDILTVRSASTEAPLSAAVVPSVAFYHQPLVSARGVAPRHDPVAPAHESVALDHVRSAPEHEYAAPGRDSAALGHESAAPGHDSVAPGHESALAHDSAAPGQASAAPGLARAAPDPGHSAPGHDPAARSGHDPENAAPGLNSAADSLGFDATPQEPSPNASPEDLPYAGEVDLADVSSAGAHACTEPHGPSPGSMLGASGGRLDLREQLSGGVQNLNTKTPPVLGANTEPVTESGVSLRSEVFDQRPSICESPVEVPRYANSFSFVAAGRPALTDANPQREERAATLDYDSAIEQSYRVPDALTREEACGVSAGRGSQSSSHTAHPVDSDDPTGIVALPSPADVFGLALVPNVYVQPQRTPPGALSTESHRAKLTIIAVHSELQIEVDGAALSPRRDARTSSGGASRASLEERRSSDNEASTGVTGYLARPAFRKAMCVAGVAAVASYAIWRYMR